LDGAQTPDRVTPEVAAMTFAVFEVVEEPARAVAAELVGDTPQKAGYASTLTRPSHAG
jgi:hypothetical protein